jgi:hypothetical protein
MQDFMDRASGKKPDKKPDPSAQDDGPKPQDQGGQQQGGQAGGKQQPSQQDPTNPQTGQGGQRADNPSPSDLKPSDQQPTSPQDPANGGPSDKTTQATQGSKDPGGKTPPNFSARDGEEVKIGGTDNSEGPKVPTSDVIKDASHSGFANTTYQDIYVEYTRYAEEAMERDKVPPGYRHYINLYFDYIGPRQRR